MELRTFRDDRHNPLRRCVSTEIPVPAPTFLATSLPQYDSGLGIRVRVPSVQGSMRAMNVFSMISSIMGTLAITAVAVAETPSDTKPPSSSGGSANATILVAIDDQKPRQIISRGVMVDGVLRFVGEHVDSTHGFILAWDWAADLDPMGNARLDGEASVWNQTGERHVYDLRAAFKLDPVIMNASAVGASVRVTLEMDEDGGALDVPGGASVWSVMIDEVEVKRLHPGPFMMGGSGSGNAVADANFGAPHPSLVAPSIEEGFQVRHHCRLTSGDRAVFATDMQIGGDPSDFVRRRDVERPVRIGGENPERRVIQIGSSSSGRAISGSRRSGNRRPATSAGRGVQIKKNARKPRTGVSRN